MGLASVDKARVVGLDVGGTFVKGALVDLDGNVIEERRWPSGAACATAAGLISELVGHVAEFQANSPVSAVGIGIAGLVDGDGGVVRQSPNFPMWRDVELVGGLARHGVAVPIAVDNDANAAAVGEALFGAARNARSFVQLTLGTGVGGAVFLGGKLLRGDDGFAGELGHMVIVPQGRPCGCGGHGCLEQYASLNGLRHAVLEHSIDLDDAEALAAQPDLPLRLAALARAGHPAALACFQQLGFYLGLGIASLLNILNTKLVVLGGGISEVMDLFQHTMLETIGQQAFPPVFRNTRIVRAALGNGAGVRGAAALAVQQIV